MRKQSLCVAVVVVSVSGATVATASYLTGDVSAPGALSATADYVDPYLLRNELDAPGHSPGEAFDPAVWLVAASGPHGQAIYSEEATEVEVFALNGARDERLLSTAPASLRTVMASRRAKIRFPARAVAVPTGLAVVTFGLLFALARRQT